jgi:hypothetical protein
MRHSVLAYLGAATFGVGPVEYNGGVNLLIGQLEVVPDCGPRGAALHEIGDVTRRDPSALDHGLATENIFAAHDVIVLASLQCLERPEQFLSDAFDGEHEAMQAGLALVNTGRIGDCLAHLPAQSWIKLSANLLYRKQIEEIGSAHLAPGPAANADDFRVDFSVDVPYWQTGYEGRFRNRQARFGQFHHWPAPKSSIAMD